MVMWGTVFSCLNFLGINCVKLCLIKRITTNKYLQLPTIAASHGNLSKKISQVTVFFLFLSSTKDHFFLLWFIIIQGLLSLNS